MVKAVPADSMSRSSLHIGCQKNGGYHRASITLSAFPPRNHIASDHRKNMAANTPPPTSPEIFLESAPERKPAVGDVVSVGVDVGTAVDSVRPVCPVAVADAVAICELAKAVTNSSNIVVWLALQ